MEELEVIEPTSVAFESYSDSFHLPPYVDKRFRVSRSRKVIELEYQSEAAIKCKQRFEKNRDKLFTFLNYDGVPWNNNNAETCYQGIWCTSYRVMGGLSTVKGIEEYLTLLTICETCKYSGVDFLDFLRSDENDIEAFTNSHRRKPRGHTGNNRLGT